MAHRERDVSELREDRLEKAVFVTRVVLNNYKSIRECSVPLGPITYLIGRNGAGKSNFLDAVRFTADALNTSLEHALRDRGGINEVRRRSSGHPTHFGVRLEWKLLDNAQGVFAFRVGSKKERGFEVQREECRIYSGTPISEHFYVVESGEVQRASFSSGPVSSPDRLYLVAVSGLPEFRPIYDALTHMGFYNLNPNQIKDLQPPDPGEVLKPDGSNLASMLAVMEKNDPDTKKRVVDYLSQVVNGIEGVGARHVARKETLEFRQRIGNNQYPWKFTAENMSDGTLRALGVLIALFQNLNMGSARVPFVGIEEPEVAVHPGAAAALRDALHDASRHTQIAVTSHSPDLLDDKDVSADSILVVTNKGGETRIGPLDESGKTAIRDRLYTAGELLRSTSLEPDLSNEGMSKRPLTLFADLDTP